MNHVRVPGFDAPRSLFHLKLLDLVYSVRARGELPSADLLVTNTFWLPVLVRSSRFGQLYVHVARYPKGQMKLYRHAARLQTVSRAMVDAICKEDPTAARKVRAIPYPLDCTAGLPPPITGSHRKKQLLYVGRIHPEKGIELLIESFMRLRRPEFDEWRLVIVGPAEVKFGGGGNGFLDHLQTLAKPIEDRVTWIGPEFDREKLAWHYRQATVFVYPSLAERGETFGLAPLEAMACGCVPVVSNLECFRDFITDGQTGHVFDHRADDPADALAVKLQDVLTNTAGLHATKRQAEQYSRNFRLETIAGRYLEDFASVTVK